MVKSSPEEVIFDLTHGDLGEKEVACSYQCCYQTIFTDPNKATKEANQPQCAGTTFSAAFRECVKKVA